MNKQVIVSWSGGKDSCLAAYKAQQAGFEIAYLANTIARDSQRVRFHGVRKEVIQRQAELLGIRLLQKETTPENYEQEFVENIGRGVTSEIGGLVLGDIHLQHCYDWAELVCRKLQLELIEPLWQKKQIELLEEFISAGFKALVVSTQANLLGKEWVGRRIDQMFLSDIQKLPYIDPCGENGEYHSLVVAGPLFRKPFTIKRAEKVLINGY